MLGGMAQIGTPGGTPERPAVFFTGPEEFRAWLEANHASAPELWMGLRRAHVEDRGLTWADAVPEALCFGWIDSANQPVDADTRRQRWTPRRPGSVWSAVNVAHVERLLAEGRMHPAGIAAFEARRADRTGVYSHENDAVDLDGERLARLRADPAALAFWEAATPGYRRAVTWWIGSAKREDTRERRLTQLIEDSRAGRLVPPQRPGGAPAWLARAARAAAEADPGTGGRG